MDFSGIGGLLQLLRPRDRSNDLYPQVNSQAAPDEVLYGLPDVREGPLSLARPIGSLGKSLAFANVPDIDQDLRRILGMDYNAGYTNPYNQKYPYP